MATIMAGDALLFASVGLALGAGVLIGPFGLYAVYALQPDVTPPRWVSGAICGGAACAVAVPLVLQVLWPAEYVLHAVVWRISAAVGYGVAVGAAVLRWYRCQDASRA